MVRRRSIFCRTSAAPSIDTVLYFRSSDSCRHRFAITAARAAPPAAARTDTKVGEPVRHSETFDVPAAELLATIRQHGLEGIVAKRRSSTYRPGDRSGDWVKLRANKGQELVIGGYVPSSSTFDSILVGYYEGRNLRYYAARIRAGFVPAHRQQVFAQFR